MSGSNDFGIFGNIKRVCAVVSGRAVFRNIRPLFRESLKDMKQIILNSDF
jgi:hypothetical protein